MFFQNKRQKKSVVRARKSRRTIRYKYPSLLDLWLQRTSYFSQFGLFLLTTGTIYFTVIPLYQKAILEEQIAQKEIELTKIQEKLESTYRKNRSSVLKDFTSNASVQCSGLMIPLEERGISQINPDGESNQFVDSTLSIKSDDCLIQMLNSSRIDELRIEDVATLRAEVSALAKTLEETRQKALDYYFKVEESVAQKPLDMTLDDLKKPLVKYVLENQPTELQSSMLRQIAVTSERNTIVFEYSDKVRAEVLRLRKIDWTMNAQNDTNM